MDQILVGARLVSARQLAPNAKVIGKAVKQGTSKSSGLEYRVVGARGLVLLVLPSGCATWYFYYDVKNGGKRHRRKLKVGRVDAVPLSHALAEAQKLRVQVAEGRDPAATTSATDAVLTFAQLAILRVESGDLRASTKLEYRLVLTKDILPVLGKVPAKEVTRANVVSVIEPMSQRGATRRADTARAMISSIFGFGIDRGLVDENPALGLRRRHNYKPRDVVFTPAQLRQLWIAMDTGDARMSQTVCNVIRLAILTGQRRAEIVGLRQADIEWNEKAPKLTIARDRAKNHNQHHVPLSPMAYQVCSAAKLAAANSEYLFPGPDGKSIHPRSVSKAMERTRDQLGFGHVNVHDLRRTVGTLLAKHGVPREIRERILNHGGKRSYSVTESVYSWYDYELEKRAALTLWADILVAIVEGSGAKLDSYNRRLAALKGSDVIHFEP